VAADETFTVDAALTNSATAPGAITLQSTPAGARVFLDGQDTGRTAPGTLQDVPAGQHVVEFRLDGFHPFREEVALGGGATATAAPTLLQLGNGRVTGRVLDPEGNGMVGAQVAVQGTAVSTRTTAYGLFTLENVPQGTHSLNAALTTGGNTLSGVREGVQVVDGLLTSNMDIITALGGASGTLYGRVSDAFGQAVEGAAIFASLAVPPNFTPDSTVAPRTVESDAGGAYSLQGLPPGFWVITAAYPGMGTLTHGINPQVYVSAGASVKIDFALPSSPSASIGTPQGLNALAFTVPSAASRARGAYDGFRERLMQAKITGRWGARAARPATRAGQLRARTAPPGSMIEIDLSWSSPGSRDVIGYFIGRSSQRNTGFALIQDLLNPHAGLWIDYDSRLSPGQSYFYRITAVNSGGRHSDASNVAEARPLGQFTAQGPWGTTQAAAPTFSWEALPGAFLYGVQLYDRFPDRAVDPIWESDRVYAPQTSVAYSGTPLQPGKTYYWIVAAGNSASLDTITGWSFSQLLAFTLE
jgi:hypothetical protein